MSDDPLELDPETMRRLGYRTVDLLVDRLEGLEAAPPGTAGVLVSGGSHANLTALACAREARLGADAGDAVVYASSQTHSSVARGLRVLGFQPEQLRTLPVDERVRVSASDVAAAIREDARAGRSSSTLASTRFARRSTGASISRSSQRGESSRRLLWSFSRPRRSGSSAFAGASRRLTRPSSSARTQRSSTPSPRAGSQCCHRPA